MSDKEELELEDDLVVDDVDDSVPTPVETAKSNLTKRRIIDNFLEERRLHKQLAEYDYDF